MKRIVLFAAIMACAITGTTASNHFDGAQWVGPAGDDMPLYADALPVFRLNFDVTVQVGSCATLVYGLNDPRLMDANMNIYNLEAQPDSSAVRLCFAHDGRLSVFRSGYHPDDDSSRPLAVMNAGEAWFTGASNKVEVLSNLGVTTIIINNTRIGELNINPVGRGGDYIAFPVLAEMAVEISGHAAISNLSVRNLREPSATLYSRPQAMTHSQKIELPQRSMPVLRTAIDIVPDRTLRSAVMTITARGIYDLDVNGCRITADDYFYPGSTQYNKTHLYHRFDIRQELKPGKNTVEVQLAEGWWSGAATYMGDRWNYFGDRQSILAKIDIEYTDGLISSYVSNPDSWEYSVDGPVKLGSFFQGEIFDATRLDIPRRWKPAAAISADTTAFAFPGGWTDVNLIPTYGDRVTAVDTLTSIAVSEPRPGVFVYDMGQNFAGVALLDLDGIPRGTQLSMRYAEVLYPDMEQYADKRGMIMTENLRAAMCRDLYTVRGTDG